MQFQHILARGAKPYSEHFLVYQMRQSKWKDPVAILHYTSPFMLSHPCSFLVWKKAGNRWIGKSFTDPAMSAAFCFAQTPLTTAPFVFQSVYFAVITLTSTGLGDFVPTTDPNKIICSIFIYFGVACIGLLLGTYIAGTLDDRAVHDAKEKQIQSCPNCARLQTIKERSARRSQKAAGFAADDLMVSPLIRKNSPRRMSERIGLERVPFDQQAQHTAVYTPRHHHHHHHHEQQINSQHAQEQNPSSHQHRQASPPLLPGGNAGNSQCQATEVADSPATTGSRQQRSMDTLPTPPPPPPPPISSYQLLTPTQQVKQAAILGSPMTRQILARQKHSRHGSIDISNKSFLGPRKYSGDIPSFHTSPPTMSSIGEGIPLEQAEAPPNLPFVGQNANYSRGNSNNNNNNTASSDDADDASSCTSSSSDLSTVDELIDDRVSNMKAAKYVFLTLRQALVNSLLIIAVGCIGFWLIESFSLVDSWYFTTVLLTTVGYGDIVPVTRGGKLFATVYLLVGGTVLLNNMSLISMIPLELRKRRIERAVLTQFGDHLDDAALRELATGPVIQRLSLSAQRADGLDECTREMFALAMLVRLGKVTEQDIKETFASFRRLDVNNEGVLNSKSIIAGMIAKRRTARASGVFTNNDGHPPPPPLSSMNLQTFQDTQQQDLVMPGYYGMAGNGPLLADALPPYQYDGDPEAGMGREEYDWALGGAYWLQGTGVGSSSFNSSNFSSDEDDTEDNNPEAAVTESFSKA
jgi:Ion channel